MEPCLFRHGKFSVEYDPTPAPQASMEPCLFRHGKRGVPGMWSPVTVKLQWSHVFSDMVSHAVRSAANTSDRLQWSHVFSDMVRECQGGGGAAG